MPLDQNPHQTVTRFVCVGFSMYACGFSVPHIRQFFLFTYPPKSKWASFEETIFFAKTGIFCKSIAGSLPSVVQAYTLPYLFGERIKLIICQIRHELSVIIHHISTSWKMLNVYFVSVERRVPYLHFFRFAIGIATNLNRISAEYAICKHWKSPWFNR